MCRAEAAPDRHGDRPGRDPRPGRRAARPRTAATPGTITEQDVLADYAAYLLAAGAGAPAAACAVVVDAGNGMAGLTAPGGARPGRRRRRARSTSSSTAPSRTTRPTRSSRPTCVDLQARVRETGADIGLAFDGDADRCFLVDERGELVSPSTLTALIAARELAKEPGRDGHPQPDHLPRPCPRSSASSAARPCAPGSATPSSRRGWPRPARSSAASTPATSTSATSGGPTPGCSPRCTRWPRWPRPTRPLSEVLAPYARHVASGEINSEVADQAAVVAELEQTWTGRDGRRGGPPRRAHRHRTTTGGSMFARPTPSRCCGSTPRAQTVPPWTGCATTSWP